jgi:hypothetical protein
MKKKYLHKVSDDEEEMEALAIDHSASSYDCYEFDSDEPNDEMNGI